MNDVITFEQLMKLNLFVESINNSAVVAIYYDEDSDKKIEFVTESTNHYFYEKDDELHYDPKRNRWVSIIMAADNNMYLSPLNDKFSIWANRLTPDNLTQVVKEYMNDL